MVNSTPTQQTPTNPNPITSPVITTSTTSEKASDKTPLPATAETISQPEDTKTSLSSEATLKSESEPNQTSPATASTIIPDRSTTSSEKSDKIAVTNSTETVAASQNIPSTDTTSTDKQSPLATLDDKIDSDKKAPLPSNSEIKDSEKQLPVAEAAAKIDSDKKSPTVDATPTEKPSSDSQLPPTTQPPTASLIPATSNPVLSDTNISAEVNSTDSTNPVQTASQALTDKQNDSGKVDPLKTEPAAIPKTAASENVAVTTATAAVQTPEKSPNNTDSVSENKQPVKTESIVSQSVGAESIKTDTTATPSISKPPAETESIIAPIASHSPATTDSLGSNVGEESPKETNLNVSTAAEQLPTKNESIIPTEIEASGTVENESAFPERTAELEGEQLPTKTDSLYPAEFTARTIERDIVVSFTAAELETEKTPALAVNSLAPEPNLKNHNSDSNSTETVAVLPAYSDTEISPKTAEMTSGLLPWATEESAQLSDNIADSQPNSTQRTGDFQRNTNPSITAAANSPIPGTFLVDDQGKVKFDYQFDGGYYTGEVGIFSLVGMEEFTPGTPEFIAEASRRVLSNSTDGHVVISDSKEGAKFTGAMPFDGDWGSGEYQGIKTFNMTPGDTFAVMLVPNATIQSSFQSSYSGNLFPENRPLFSIATANPSDTAHLLQIADITGTGNTFALEDMSAANSDRDYNDLIFKISGATGNAPLLGRRFSIRS